MTIETRPLVALLSLGLLLTTVAACDSEAEDLDLAQDHAAALEQALELSEGVELELERVVAGPERPEFDSGDEASLLFTEVTDLAPPLAEGTCGGGHVEYRSDSSGCNTCQFDEDELGKKFTHYSRWCWDGPPSCGGCGGWQYTGWNCLKGCW